MIKAEERLIVALDVDNIEDAQALVEKLEGVVSFFKIGMELYLVGGPEFVKRTVGANKNVFLDLKFFDVPETVKRAVARAAKLGVRFATIHGNKQIINAAVEGRSDSGLKLLAVTALTCLDTTDIQEMGYACSVQELVLKRAGYAMDAGCDGVISSGAEAQRIKEFSKGKLLVVTPGIRPSSGGKDDHKRSVSAAEAIEGGADYLVVGRPITRASDPRAAAETLVAEMKEAFARKGMNARRTC